MNKLKLLGIRLRQEFHHKKAFFRILLAVCSCTLTVVALLSTMMYQSTRRLMTQQSIELSVQTFAQIQSVVDSMAAAANSLATQMFLDETCSQLLLALEESQISQLDAYKAVRQLTLYKNIHPNIDSIYIYNRNLDCVFTSQGKSIYLGVDSFYDQQLLELLDCYSDYQSRGLIKRRMPKDMSNFYANERDVYTYIIGNTYNEDYLVNGVIINFSDDWMLDQLLTSQSLENSLLEVLDDVEAEPLISVSTGMDGVELEVFKQPVEKLAAQGKSYGEFTNAGERYFISYLHSEKLGWSFVKVSLWDTVFASLKSLQRGVWILVGVILFICVLLSFLGAGSIYRFYMVVEQGYNKLAGSRRSNVDRMRDNLLNDYILGTKETSVRQLTARLEEVDIHLEADRPYLLAVLLVDGYESLRERYGSSAMYGIKYGLRNIFEELGQSAMGTLGALGQDNQLLFLCWNHDGGPLSPQTVAAVFEQFCLRAGVFIDTRYTMVGASQQQSLTGLNQLWHSLAPALRETFFYPSGQYLDSETILAEHSGQLDAHHLEHHIVQTLLQGDLEETCHQYHKFTANLQSCGVEDYTNTLIWMGLSVVRTVSDLQNGSRDSRSYFSDFIVRLMACSKQQEVDALFEVLFRDSVELILQANNKSGAIGKVEEVQTYIAQRYTDSNLSLESVADAFGLSASYLGKVFRRSCSLSVAEYINQIRLEEVERQMSSSQKSIKDIAADCGFGGTNYFYTYFKKRYGLTPQAYRDRQKQRG